MQAPGDLAHGGISPTGHEEEAGKACCTDINQDTAGAQSQADTELSTPSSDPEPQKPLPLKQQGDLEPSMAEHGGKKAGAVHVSMWGGGAEPHRRSPPDLGLGLEQRLASHHPSLTL